ncbi:MAG: lysophospholipid acyltransferase family protein [Gammaproteobacteria bacterium]|nr:lysophospholipid acyltransferase family protein [Gammaproteobacteria bacterium]
MSSKNSESKPIKTQLVYGLIWLFAKLPLGFTQWLMGLFARLAMLLNSRSYHVSLVNIGLCFPDLSAHEQKVLAQKSLLHTFKIAPEIAKAWLNPCIQDWIENVYGEASIQEDLANGHGVLITGSHLGNWEVALFYLGKTFDFTCMYRKPRYQELDDIICKGRCKNTTVMVPGDAKGLREFLKVLKACKVAALLSDQEPGGDTGVFVPFFGQEAKTMDLIQKIQKKSKAKLYQIAAIKNANGKYDIHLPSIEIDTELSAADYASQLNLELEKIIRKYPEQYQWSYKRFKTTQDGSANPYAK